MPLDPTQLTQLKRAYEVLGLPQTASAPAIKQSYRKLTKRWHPDLYPAGSPQQSEATQMMKVINESYDLISTAPLRYYDESYADKREPYVEGVRIPRPQDLSRQKDSPPRFDRMEFWVRFICGALFGMLMAFGSLLRMTIYHFTPGVAVAGVVIVLFFAFGSAFGGDDFWYGMFRRSRRWW